MEKQLLDLTERILTCASVDRLLPIHISQALTYLKHSNLWVGLLLNFNVQSLRDGIRRFDNRNRSPESLPRLPRLALPGR